MNKEFVQFGLTDAGNIKRGSIIYSKAEIVQVLNKQHVKIMELAEEMDNNRRIQK